MFERISRCLFALSICRKQTRMSSWVGAVVFADSFNNRVHMPDERRSRAYELDGRPIYLAVLFRQLRGQADLPAVPLERDLPAPRIDTETYRQILTRLTELSHDSGFRLVLLAGGDHPSIENWARSALGDVRSGLWERVLGQATELRAGFSHDSI